MYISLKQFVFHFVFRHQPRAKTTLGTRFFGHARVLKEVDFHIFYCFVDIPVVWKELPWWTEGISFVSASSCRLKKQEIQTFCCQIKTIYMCKYHSYNSSRWAIISILSNSNQCSSSIVSKKKEASFKRDDIMALQWRLWEKIYSVY